ncbi:Diphthine--ammonia ligase [Anabarilius grahami]|uniref:Diphthine--ammonia ligase n=1 Tax=Anabarilius grahami TaxID=495550 RepID=A0A3N0XGQ1_ANAGA|nr:Diphthine--ammonia ligase [Anabarilius grahami]
MWDINPLLLVHHLVSDSFLHPLVVQEETHVEAVSVGAILSDYQRVRVENVVSGVTLPVYLTAHEATGHSRIVLIALIAQALSLTCDAGIERTCARLQLQPLAYLWRRDQAELLREIISSGLNALLIKVAAFGMLNISRRRTLVQMSPELSAGTAYPQTPTAPPALDKSSSKSKFPTCLEECNYARTPRSAPSECSSPLQHDSLKTRRLKFSFPSGLVVWTLSSESLSLLCCVCLAGLDPERHLGKSLAEMEPYLHELSEKYGVHICGEGGEYETLTIDCPLFKKKIVIDSAETVIHSADAFAPVGYLRFTRMHTEDKKEGSGGRPLPLSRCPCQNAIDRMTEELEYADKTPDVQGGCCLPSHSGRSSAGYQWITGLTALQSEHTDVQSQTRHVFTLLQNVVLSLRARVVFYADACEEIMKNMKRRAVGRCFWALVCSSAHQTLTANRPLFTNTLSFSRLLCWQNALLRGRLQENGWLMKHVLLVHLYVSDMESFSQINSVYRTFFKHNPPARVCVQASLPVGQQLLMDVLLHERTAACENDSFPQRDTLHVQSLSHWAPANIGPYSQAVRPLAVPVRTRRPLPRARNEKSSADDESADSLPSARFPLPFLGIITD